MDSRSEASRLRLGIVVDSTTVPRWIGRLFEAIAASPIAEITAVRIQPSRTSSRSSALAALFNRVDRQWFQSSAPLLENVDLAPRFAALSPNSSVDVSLCLGSDIPQPESATPQLGIWTVHVGGLSTDRMEDWAVMDVLLRRTAIAVELRATFGNGATHLIGRSMAQNDARSPTRARQRIVSSIQMLLLKALERAAQGLDLLLAGDGSMLSSPWIADSPECLGNRQMVLLLTEHALRFARERIDLAAYNTSWALAWQIDSQFPSTRPFRLAVPPNDRFWADPFIGFDRGRRYIFFEELRYATSKGSIAMMALGEDGQPGIPEVVLERPYHLSFPFVFSRNGDHFMIPETSASGQIELFRARRFPHDWELIEVLMPSIHAADVTLLEYGGYWWMFADIAKDGTAIHGETLHLFHAPDPFGPWAAHRGNPVVWSAEHSRPAGAVFRLGDKLIRPAQDCKNGYGRAASLRQITTLSPDSYSERFVQMLEPDWDPRITGVHTFNRQGDVTAIDCRLRTPR